MTGIAHIAAPTSGQALPARLGHGRVEKASNCSDLGQQRMEDRRQDGAHHAHATPRDLSQSETNEHAPLWHGPRLRPAFVAQVLGQVMAAPARRDSRSVFAAYEEGAARAPLRRGFERQV